MSWAIEKKYSETFCFLLGGRFDTKAEAEAHRKEIVQSDSSPFKTKLVEVPNMTADEIAVAAHTLAMKHIQTDVDRGYTVQAIQSSYHGAGGPDYHADVLSGYKVHITRVNGFDCDFMFDLRKLYAECKRGQVAML